MVSRKVGIPSKISLFLPRMYKLERWFLCKFTRGKCNREARKKPCLARLFTAAFAASGTVAAAAGAASFCAGLEHGTYCREHNRSQYTQNDDITHDSYLLFENHI